MKLGVFLLLGALTCSLFIMGCAESQIVTDANGNSMTNYVPNATAESIGNQAKAAAPMIGSAIPAPYSAPVTLAIGLLGLLTTAGASLVAKVQNNRANLHMSTLQAVVNGVENAVPDIHAVITSVAGSGVVSDNAAKSLTTADNILSAVKGSIASATQASGTAANLNNILAKQGIGPTSQ